MPETVILKKYANRRLYDTRQSVYVTLEQVADMIKEGTTIRALDAKTREDVTEFVLTQILLEQARQKHFFLPASLLHIMIRFGDNLLGEFFEKYLEQTLKNYLEYRSKMDDQFKNWLKFGAGMTGVAQKSLAGLTPFHSFFKKEAGETDDED